MTKLVISSGDPAGIGPDICIKAFGLRKEFNYHPVILGDPYLFEERSKLLGFPISIIEYKGEDPNILSKDYLWILPCYLNQKIEPGEPDPSYAQYVMNMLKLAVSKTMQGEFKALVTGPVNKELLNKGGINFSGHTELLAKLSKSTKVLMMLTSNDLRVALATTHVPISRVTEKITYKHIKDCLNILHSNLQTKWLISRPHLKVLGLNPHAGEGGFIGHEDKEIIMPVIKDLNRKGLNITGPVSADTAFITKNLEGVDAILAMYHDQGLPAFKTKNFGNAVNITLGLPFIRTSVDHGTAYDMAGKTEVDETSLLEATELADKISKK